MRLLGALLVAAAAAHAYEVNLSEATIEGGTSWRWRTPLSQDSILDLVSLQFPASSGCDYAQVRINGFYIFEIAAEKGEILYAPPRETYAAGWFDFVLENTRSCSITVNPILRFSFVTPAPAPVLPTPYPTPSPPYTTPGCPPVGNMQLKGLVCGSGNTTVFLAEKEWFRPCEPSKGFLYDRELFLQRDGSAYKVWRSDIQESERIECGSDPCGNRFLVSFSCDQPYLSDAGSGSSDVPYAAIAGIGSAVGLVSCAFCAVVGAGALYFLKRRGGGAARESPPHSELRQPVLVN